LAPCLQLHDTINETPSGPTTLTAFNSRFVPSTTPILPDPRLTPWTPHLITFNHDPINADLDMLPTGTFTVHTHPTVHDTSILCTPDGRAVTTLSGPRMRHLFQIFRPDLTHFSFEEEIYHIITRLGSRSEIHSPTPHTTTRNKWVTREDLLTALGNTFHIYTELYSYPLNKSLHSHTYHSLYLEDIVFSSSGSNAPHKWHGTNNANP
jgi:hypothetical protein